MIPALVALLQIATPSSSPIPPRPGPDDVFDVVPVAAGVWAALVKPAPAAYAFANSLVVAWDDGVLVVDTQQSPTAARALVQWIGEHLGRPVRWVVNTHWHGDHVYGNQAYREAFPGVRFVGHTSTRTGVLEDAAAAREEELDELPGTIRDRRRWLDTGRGPDGKELSPEGREAVARSLALRQAYLRDLEDLDLVPPDVTFTDRMTLHTGGRTVELIHLGPAHTAGDIVVRLPEEGVLAVGDLLEDGPPWLEGAWIPGWAAALSRLRELPERIVLVSHGTLHRDRELLDWQARFMEDLAGTASSAHREGWTAEEALKRSDLRSFREPLAS
ncbi:MAG TPA: MBL fold metallo-hydrolase, partial [Longimicrobiales bacterium]|nr:MBL fold metallo-hydrolase [Longimicrobiales bacterium]